MTGLLQILGSPEILLAVGMLAGLAAAYGRELTSRRRPGWRWWLSRLLLLPAAAIVSVAIDSSLSLSGELRMLLAMLTILRGYDGLALLEKQYMHHLLRVFSGACRQPSAEDGALGLVRTRSAKIESQP